MDFYFEDYGIFFFLKVFQLYWPGMVLPVMSVFSWLYIYRKKDNVWKSLLLYPSMIILLTVLNPFLMYGVLMVMSWSDRYLSLIHI